MDLKSEIIRRIHALSGEQQRQLLAYCDTFERASLPGEEGKALLAFWGTLDHQSATEMSDAIESACETVDLREW